MEASQLGRLNIGVIDTHCIRYRFVGGCIWKLRHARCTDSRERVIEWNVQRSIPVVATDETTAALSYVVGRLNGRRQNNAYGAHIKTTSGPLPVRRSVGKAGSFLWSPGP